MSTTSSLFKSLLRPLREIGGTSLLSSLSSSLPQISKPSSSVVSLQHFRRNVRTLLFETTTTSLNEQLSSATTPSVYVASSTLNNKTTNENCKKTVTVGRGVFCSGSSNSYSNDGAAGITTGGAKRGDLLCFYPGVYSPGIPPGVLCSPFDGNNNMLDAEELGELTIATTTTPSGVDPDQNAYLLNLHDLPQGGYIDAVALTVTKDGDKPVPTFSDQPEQEHQQQNKNQRQRRLDEHPLACGHLINHSSSAANVAVRSFLWSDIFQHDDDDHQINSEYISYNRKDDSYHTFSSALLPNVVRADGTLRYVLSAGLPEQDKVYHDGSAPNCGAVFWALRDISEHEELLFNYQLSSKKPYPSWAADWYV